MVWRSPGLRWVLAIALIIWFSLTPLALAQDNTVDYTLTDLSFRDFSGQNLSGTSFAAAEMREANFTGTDLSRTILTKASFPAGQPEPGRSIRHLCRPGNF